MLLHRLLHGNRSVCVRYAQRLQNTQHTTSSTRQDTAFRDATPGSPWKTQGFRRPSHHRQLRFFLFVRVPGFRPAVLQSSTRGAPGCSRQPPPRPPGRSRSLKLVRSSSERLLNAPAATSELLGCFVLFGIIYNTLAARTADSYCRYYAATPVSETPTSAKIYKKRPQT